MGNEELYAAMDKLTREILAIEKLRGKLVDLFVRKNTDYGNDQIVEFGEFGILVRSTDKLNRLKNLVGKVSILRTVIVRLLFIYIENLVLGIC